MLAPELVQSLCGFDVVEMERLLQLPKRSGYYRIKRGDIAAFVGVDGKLKISPLEVLRKMHEMEED